MSDLLSRAIARSGAPAPGADARRGISASCIHCTLPILGAPCLWVEFEGRQRPVCCAGCQAVFNVVVAHGMTDLYRERNAGAA